MKNRSFSKEFSKRPRDIILVSLASIAIAGALFVEAAHKRPAVAQSIIHRNIVASVFWVGEGATSANGHISNASSAWVENWAQEFGGIDNPNNRVGYDPRGVKLTENDFYAALPANDYDNNGNLKPARVLKVIPWYKGSPAEGQSLLKNRWIKVTHGDKTVYVQWEDVGPFGENDFGYVFGNARPNNRQGLKAGIDLAPAAASYLELTPANKLSDASGKVSWQFIDESQVPTGPWKRIVTISEINN
jgi:hypothetical protein